MEENRNINKDEDLELQNLEKVTEPKPQPEKDDGHKHGGEETGWKNHWDLLLALMILITLLVLEYGFNLQIANIPLLAVNLIAYFLAGRKVLYLAGRKSKRGDFFNEFVLMSVATIGAFIIGEYEEGVAVMVFYQIGEWFQDSAVNRAKRSIKALLDIRPDEVTVLRNGKAEVTDPAKVALGENIQVKPGEKVALDGDLMSEKSLLQHSRVNGGKQT